MPRIEELAVTGSHTIRATPGWTLVADRNYIDPSKAPLNPSSNARGKRSTRFEGTVLSGDALTSRQERAIQQRIDALNSENNKERKDIAIAIPKKDIAGKKQTPGVKKILQSEKTFRHHLEEEEAFLKQQVDAGGSSTSLAAAGQIAPTWAIPQPHTPKKKRKAAAQEDGDVKMVDAPAAEANPLFAIETPSMPSQDELLKLMTAPPLVYNAAKAGPPPADAPPQRHFCSICGYWGQVKCLRCGERLCGWIHKEEHDESCNIYR